MNGKISYNGLQLAYITATSVTVNGYNASFKDNAFGWLTGISYQNNDSGLKTSITYRSKINHKFNSDENDKLTKNNLASMTQTSSIVALFDYKTGHTGSFNTPSQLILI